MEETTALTVLVVQASAPPTSVIDTIRGLGDGGLPVEVQVLPASAGDHRVFENADFGVESNVDVSVMAEGAVPLDLRALCPTQFVAVVRPGDTLLPQTLERHLRALDHHPEAVLSVCTASENEDVGTAGPHTWIPPNDPDGGPEIIDGRALARAIIFSCGQPLPRPSVVLLRSNALAVVRSPTDRARQEVPWVLGPEWYRLILQTLIRGPVWVDPMPGVITPTSRGDMERPQWEHWPDLVTTASELGLLDQPGDMARALIAYTRRSATLLRRQLGPDLVASTDDAARMVRRITTSWRSLITAEAALPPLLPLHVVVLADDDATGPGAAAKTFDAATGLVRSVTILEPSTTESSDGLTDVPAAQSAWGSWTADSRLHTLIDKSDLPVLVVKAGERLDILDRSQFRTLLDNEEPRSIGNIATPSGRQVRLVWPGSAAALGADDDRGTPVHSLRAISAEHGANPDWLPRPAPTKTSHRLRKFVVVAPDYTEAHGGVVALHRLCDRLNAIGYEAFIHPIGALAETRPGWLTPLRRGRSLKDVVAIYPEIVTGNLLGADRVVRWLLNRPGWFTGRTMDEGPDDLVVAFNTQISPGHPVLSVPLNDPTVFFPKDRPGSGSLLWIGKGTVPSHFDRSETVLITNNWPARREELAALLRAADVLYTCDWLTSVIDEALLCGTPVVLIGDQAWARHEVTMRPGMTWEHQDDIDDTRKQAGQYFPHYLDVLASVDESVERFVQLVNDHFDPEQTPASSSNR